MSERRHVALEMADEGRRLRARVAALENDSKRMSWLSDRIMAVDAEAWALLGLPNGASLRNAVDEAMEREND